MTNLAIPRQILRPCQVDALESMRAEIRRGHHGVLLVAATGFGKTTCAASMIESAVKKQKRVVFLCHRKELIEQCSERLDGLGVDHGIIMANHWRRCPALLVHVASVQTLVNRELDKAPDILVIDECHRAASTTYVSIRERFPNAIVIGLTATPIRTDGRGLGGKLFSAMVQSPSVRELTDMGYLVPTRVYAPTNPDLTGVHSAGGDYKPGELQHAMDKPKITGDVVSHWLKLGEDRQTILFASGVEASKHLAEAFRAAGVAAIHLDGESSSEDRTNGLAAVRAGTVRIVCNVALFTEGFDSPITSCIVDVAPTQSLGRYLQKFGRGLRPYPGKTDCIIISHAGVSHGFVDDERDWKLTEDRMHKKGLTIDTSVGVKVCPRCFLALRPEIRECNCGYLFDMRPRKGPRQVAGELQEITPEMREARYTTIPQDRRTQMYCRWVKEAAEKGYKPGFAKGRYYAMFHCWPRENL